MLNSRVDIDQGDADELLAAVHIIIILELLTEYTSSQVIHSEKRKWPVLAS